MATTTDPTGLTGHTGLPTRECTLGTDTEVTDMEATDTEATGTGTGGRSDLN